jgi:hypothetical protein
MYVKHHAVGCDRLGRRQVAKEQLHARPVARDSQMDFAWIELRDSRRRHGTFSAFDCSLENGAKVAASQSQLVRRLPKRPRELSDLGKTAGSMERLLYRDKSGVAGDGSGRSHLRRSLSFNPPKNDPRVAG